MVFINDNVIIDLDKSHHAKERKSVLREVDELLREIEKDCVRRNERKMVEQKWRGR